ncbi:MAG TPA: ABC transporter permease [Amycolatopsis sp.]|nr:ABC transporter permease [Amycolatopsis sp.]
MSVNVVVEQRPPGADPVGAAAPAWDRRRSARVLRSLNAVVGRILNIVLLLFMVSLGTFLLLKLAGGDAADLAGGEQGATAADVAAARARLGLDQSLVQQYLSWVGHAVHGNFGNSYISGLPVTDLIVQRLPVTVALIVGTVVIAVPVSIVLGLLAGANEGRWIDRVVTGLCSVSTALPTFWFGLVLSLYLALRAGWFPATGFVPISQDPVAFIEHLLLPVITLAVPLAAALTRQLRGSVAEVLSLDYVRSAEARGASRISVLGKHTLKNASIPAITLLGIQVITLIGGTIIAEAVFGLQGIGSLVISAVQSRDTPVIQGVVFCSAIFAVIVNVVLDVMYRVLSPRTRSV